jgi:hypothetical protein
MTQRIVDFLNALVSTVGGIENVYCLAERRTIEGTEIPYIYSEGGNYKPIEVDSGSVSYWRLDSKISFSEADGYRVPKPLNADYPLKFIAVVRRDELNPLYYSQDVANILEGKNKDLRQQLGANSVTITVNGIDTDTPTIWRDEFKVPVTDLHYTRAMVAIEINVNVVADRKCWIDCDSYPDILQGFPWCNKTEATLDRLTVEQIACIENYICGVPDPVTEQINGVTIGTIPSGDTNNQVIENTIGTPVGTAANPSVVPDATVQLNGATVGTIASGATDSFAVNLDGSPSGSWDGTAWQVTSVPCADATIELNGVEMTTIPSGDTENITVLQSSGATQVGSKQGTHWRIDDSPIQSSGGLFTDSVMAEETYTIADVNWTDSDGSPQTSEYSSAIVCTPSVSSSITLGAYSDAGHTTPITEADFGDTIYLLATPTGINPTSYQFYAIDSSDVMTFIAEQVGSSFTWVINSTIDVQRIYVHATDDDDNWVGVDIDFTVNGISFVNSTKFNGTDEYVSIPYNAALEFGTNERTYVTWFQLDTLSGVRGIMDAANSTISNGVSILQVNAVVSVYINSVATAISTGTLTLGVWYQITTTYNDTFGIWAVYLDGVLIGTRASTTNTNNGEAILLGLQSGFARYMDGNIALTKIYDKYFTPDDVAESYNAGTLTDPRALSTADNLVEAWTMGNGIDNSPTIYGIKGVQNATMVNMDNSNFVADVP